MAGTSDASPSASSRLQDFEYLYASNTNVSNFISEKLSGDRNYILWKAQMICLMDTHNMRGIVDPSFVGPRAAYGTEIMRQYHNLLKGWIFGSANKDVLLQILDLGSAKDVWEKLKSMYDPTTSLQQGLAPTKLKRETQDINAVSAEIVSAETHTNDKDKILIHIGEDMDLLENIKKLRKATIKGNWSKAESLLKKDKDLAKVDINGDGSTVLHMAVGIGHNDFVKNLLSIINDEHVLEKRNSDGSTALHIAAIVGNKYAAELLVKKNEKLLRIEDKKGEEPLHKAYENMHLDTIGYLLKAGDDDGERKLRTFSSGGFDHHRTHPGVEIGIDLLVNTISAKQYDLASELVNKFPRFASKSDDALMALAKTFPCGLDFWETLLYPALDKNWEAISSLAEELFDLLLSFVPELIKVFSVKNLPPAIYIIFPILFPLVGVIGILIWLFRFMFLFLRIVRFSCLVVPYFILWKGASKLGGPIKLIEDKRKEWDEAMKVMELVCNEIDKLPFSSGVYHPYYTQPILEAASQNAYKVVDEILFRSPEAIQSTNKNGYDIIQLAVINRSEKIYNLIYDIGERKNLYRTISDSSKNNILHLAGWLAPSKALNRRTGAALQLQRELQWREEVQKLVFPTYITKENIFNETPDMVFTREHENLVKEGERWMKTTAESCSITAALITTIVFAAAITVPGGSNQETGIPLFRKEMAFTIFAVSDAISLFASSTALLVFLSILTARFAEKDFLVSLPRRLLIGLFFLLLSTTAMMVAFSATLFLVFCHKKPWMIAPICGLAFIPIAFFVALQFPLMVDLFCSTHLRIFGKERKSVLRRFNPDDIRLLFRK